MNIPRRQNQNEREAADAAKDMLFTCLDHGIRHISKHRPFDLNDQHAVRILESRKRKLQREFDFMFEKGMPEQRAYWETLVLSKPDNGTLVKFHGRNHVQSWFGCRACTTSSDDIPTSLARLCTKCGHGVQHACLVVGETTQDKPEEEQTKWLVLSPQTGVNRVDWVPGVSNLPVGAPVSSQRRPDVTVDTPKVHFCCDSCGAEDVESE